MCASCRAPPAPRQARARRRPRCRAARLGKPSMRRRRCRRGDMRARPHPASRAADCRRHGDRRAYVMLSCSDMRANMRPSPCMLLHMRGSPHLRALGVGARALGQREAAEGHAKVGRDALQVGVVADHHRQLAVELACHGALAAYDTGLLRLDCRRSMQQPAACSVVVGGYTRRGKIAMPSAWQLMLWRGASKQCATVARRRGRRHAAPAPERWRMRRS